MKIGYARVSTVDQNLDLQLWRLDRLGRTMHHLIQVVQRRNLLVFFKGLRNAFSYTCQAMFFFFVKNKSGLSFR